MLIENAPVVRKKNPATGAFFDKIFQTYKSDRNASDEEIDELEEAGALKDISHMPARMKCAVLGWHTLEEAFKQEK